MNNDLFGLTGKTAVVTGGGGDLDGVLSWLESGRFAVKDWLTEIRLEDVPRLFAETDGGGRRAFKSVIRFR